MDDVCIAVMPFRNLSTEQDTEFFANGFVEDLIADLTRFQSLRVLASQSTFGLAQVNRSIYDVAERPTLSLLGKARRNSCKARKKTMGSNSTKGQPPQMLNDPS